MLVTQNLAAQITHQAMGTMMAHKAFGEYAEEALTAVRMEIDRMEGIFSRFLLQSEISSINQSAGENPVNVSEETMALLTHALEFSKRAPGCFDISIAPLVDLWRNAQAAGQPPALSRIDQALSLVNSRDLILDPANGTAGLRRRGQCIDLGSIAKGYAANQVPEIYAYFGIHSAYSNLGGNVITLGAKPDSSLWNIGIQHPRQQERMIGVVSVENQSVVTSGDYQRFFIGRDNKRYHHILNPLTGYPGDSGLCSVSIIAEDSMSADALSTILFVAGLEKGLEILKGYPQADAILVNSDLDVFITSGLSDRFQIEEGNHLSILNP
jgi:FAD:protein FMN transferase